MNIKKISSVFFSPTKSTNKLLLAITARLPINAERVDLTCYSERERALSFASDELVIFGVPVYGGRVPANAVERFGRMRGEGTPSVLVVTYGNREYDDALLELKELTERNGFRTAAAAVFIAEHSIMRSVAKGRPDSEDKKKIQAFADEVWAKIQRIESASQLGELEVPGKTPYVEFGGVPMKPETDETCVKCGACVPQCPVNAIPAESPDSTDKSLCITCLRCVMVCPACARSLNKPLLAEREKVFAQMNSARKEPEVFI